MAGAGPLATSGFVISAPALFPISQGSTATGTVFVDSLNGFNGTVSLIPNVLPNLLDGPNITLSPTDVPVTAFTSGTSTLLITTTSSTPVRSYNYTITGTGSMGGTTLVESFTGQIMILAVTLPNFTMTSIPGNQTVVAGSRAASAIVLTSLFGFSGNVTLTTSIPKTCPICPTWSISPDLVTLRADSGNAVLNFTSVFGTAVGGYTVNVTGTSGSLSHSILVGFVVVASTVDYSLTPSSTSLNIPAGQVAHVTITIASLNGFSGTIGLQTSASTIGCPPLQCTTWSLDPINVFLSSGGTTATTLTVQAGILGDSGNITVTGTSEGLSHSTIIQYSSVPSPDFALSATPNHLIFTAGSTNTSTITVFPVNSFNSTVIFSLASSQGLLAIIIPQNVSGSGTAILFLNAVAPGNYTTVVTGTSGSLVHSVAILVTVEQPPTPDLGITASPSNLTITSGSSSNSTVTMSSINGFNGDVTLSITVSSTNINATLSATTVMVPRGGIISTVLTIYTSSSTPPGMYNVTITGASGQVSRSTTILVTVKAPSICPACDINGDGIIGLDDLSFVIAHFGSEPSSSKWDPRADVNHDGKVDISDLARVAGLLGTKV